MHRLFALLAAVVLTTLTVSSATIAAPAGGLSFTLEPSTRTDRVRAHFRTGDNDRNSWSSSFAATELSGLDMAKLGARGTFPLRFAIVREAGRLDCSGTGGNSLARGACTMTPDAGFMQLLSRHGIARPTDRQAFALISLNARRSLVEALAGARYPTPGIGDLVNLTALGVTDRYVNELARTGYRPSSLGKLAEFAALKITPEYIGGFVAMGYDDLSPGELVQLKALGVTPEFVLGFQRLGYRNLPARKLVEMKALGVTPDYVRSLRREGMALPSPDQLVRLRAIGFSPRKR